MLTAQPALPVCCSTGKISTSPRAVLLEWPAPLLSAVAEAPLLSAVAEAPLLDRHPPAHSKCRQHRESRPLPCWR
eukprot:COSAG01_NODE_9719_length_2362_cov_443.650906_3_plen_75_part_00